MHFEIERLTTMACFLIVGFFQPMPKQQAGGRTHIFQGSAGSVYSSNNSLVLPMARLYSSSSSILGGENRGSASERQTTLPSQVFVFAMPWTGCATPGQASLTVDPGFLICQWKGWTNALWFHVGPSGSMFGHSTSQTLGNIVDP